MIEEEVNHEKKNRRNIEANRRKENDVKYKISVLQ